jgi:hypothetical protein
MFTGRFFGDLDIVGILDVSLPDGDRLEEGNCMLYHRKWNSYHIDANASCNCS